MTHSLFILADGFPAPLIFFGFVALIMFLSSVFGKAKPTPPVPLGGDKAEAERQRAALRRRVESLREAEAQRQNLARRGGPAAPPPMPAQMNEPRKRAAKAAAKAARPQAVRPQVVASRPQPSRPAPVAIATPAPAVTTNETARNLKLLLQRGGVREAVLLSEVLGAPKSLRDE